MIKIVGHISPDEYCVCQISKRNSENIQAKNQAKFTLRVHPSEHLELAENAPLIITWGVKVNLGLFTP